MREELLEYHWMLELCTRGRPSTVLILRNINGVIDKTHTFVRRFMLKVVPVLLAELDDLLNDLGSCIGDLDRVCLDMGNDEALALDELHEVDHEQSTTLCHNVVDVSRVAEGIRELRSRKTVDAVDNDLQRVGQGDVVHTFLEKCPQDASQKSLCGLVISSLDSDTSLLNLRVPLGVFVSEEVKRFDRTGMHTGDVE